MTVEILPATGDRTDDADHALTGGGDGPTCHCQWWMVSNAQFQRTPVDERERMLRDELTTAAVAPGLVAYVDGAPAAWVRIGPRPAQTRIGRTKGIAATTAEPLDDDTVWSLSCFAVRTEHRGEGLARRLIDAAIEHARENGARAIEAYPVDPTVRRFSANDLYHGTVQMFEDAGFTVVGRPRPDNAVVSLRLRD
jgi:GNAT superfamily N-acetyltransferase